jgi:hypothetical protein
MQPSAVHHLLFREANILMIEGISELCYNGECESPKRKTDMEKQTFVQLYIMARDPLPTSPASDARERINDSLSERFG